MDLNREGHTRRDRRGSAGAMDLSQRPAADFNPPNKPGCCGRGKVSDALKEKPHHLLGQWTATAISGNDITSSVLYMGGLCIAAAGPFAPISILLVVALLYLFRNVYTEVVTALPLNGGAYNALLNTTSKLMAALGGTLTCLSYVATAVVSADSAAQYLASLVPQAPQFWIPIMILALFALLNLLGLSESAVVALIIFIFHCATLTVLLFVCVGYCIEHGAPLLVSNWRWDTINSFGSPFQLIAYGFGAALVGVSGFESSSNYVEEQAPGVFRKTLRNMWLVVGFFNPVLCFLAICMLDVREVQRRALNSCLYNCDPLLSQMGQVAGGYWMHLLIGVDATLVLSGSVLTSYVGVGGLMRRMALDRCFPAFLLLQNPITKTNHFQIGIFFLTTSSLYLIVGGNINTLTGVYSMAFLCVMALFAMSNMLLKYKRSKLAREARSSWPGVILAFLGVVTGVILNIIKDDSIVAYFAIYFVIFLSLSMVMFVRVRVMRIAINLMKNTRCCKGSCGNRVKAYVKELNSQTVVFFTKNGVLSVLNKAVTYVRDNELTDNVIIVHLYSADEGNPMGTEPRDIVLRDKLQRIRTNVRILDRLYPKSTISLLLVQGEFNAEAVAKISAKLSIPRNFFFIASPAANFSVKLASLGGCRLITH